MCWILLVLDFPTMIVFDYSSSFPYGWLLFVLVCDNYVMKNIGTSILFKFFIYQFMYRMGC